MVSHNYCKMVQLFEGRFYNSIICIINLLISIVMQYRISLRKSCLLILFQSIFLFKKNSKVIKTMISIIIVFITLLCFLLTTWRKKLIHFCFAYKIIILNCKLPNSKKNHRYFLNQKYNDISTGNLALKFHNLGQT